MERELNQIHVIPLVDVMLVLLVIVFTTATFISTGQIPVEPAHSSSATDRKHIAIVVTSSAERAIYVNDRLISSGTLWLELAQRSRESLVLVLTGRVRLLERFVSVVDEIKSIGFRQVSLEVVRA